MLKFLAALDIFVGIIILLELFSIDIHWRIVFAGTMYMLIKAWLFWPDFFSVLDGAIGIFALVGLFFIYTPLGWASVIWIGYKSVASFI